MGPCPQLVGGACPLRMPSQRATARCSGLGLQKSWPAALCAAQPRPCKGWEGSRLVICEPRVRSAAPRRTEPLDSPTPWAELKARPRGYTQNMKKLVNYSPNSFYRTKERYGLLIIVGSVKVERTGCLRGSEIVSNSCRGRAGRWRFVGG